MRAAFAGARSDVNAKAAAGSADMSAAGSACVATEATAAGVTSAAAEAGMTSARTTTGVTSAMLCPERYGQEERERRDGCRATHTTR